ncbi:flagellar biosynthesis sigma factor [Proteus mirabilis]|uniref:Flagellar biosynthesis sigma factor n=1 Tax=Proteus mirabilis TaxID=584 RepID=A0A379GGG6_PROMI|nr:flagellar biosynthesis sigma factor [Proteus mirabilis]
MDDLLQAGGIGLLNAVERYDSMQGAAFTTYAVQRIRGSMLDELRSRDWAPRSVRRNAREVTQIHSSVRAGSRTTTIRTGSC